MSVRRLEPELPDPHRSIRPRSPAEMLEPSRAPARPKGRRKRRDSGSLSRWVRFVSSVLTGAVLILGVLGLGIFVLQHQFVAAGPLAEERTIIIPRGEGRLEIAARLEREGIIANRWTFIVNHLIHARLMGERLDMKAGEFRLEPGASMKHVLKTLVDGRSVEYKITLPEGLTSQQIVGRLQADENLTGEILTVPPEGSLLPDTYPYSRGQDRQAVLDAMAQAQQAFLDGLWEKRQPDLPINSLEEAVILASIVEKETGVAEERALTAAVFMNRLRKGMRLQSDPTIIYGIVGGQGRLGRPIRKSEIKEKTPYNTYRINGLPPTPICNPGRAAILAGLNPAATTALYFVADGTGGHAFSETLAQHNAAVARWRKIERKRAKERAARAAAAATAASAATGPVTTVSAAPSEAVAAEEPPAVEAASSGVAASEASPAAASESAGGVLLPKRKPR